MTLIIHFSFVKNNFRVLIASKCTMNAICLSTQLCAHILCEFHSSHKIAFSLQQHVHMNAWTQATEHYVYFVTCSAFTVVYYSMLCVSVFSVSISHVFHFSISPFLHFHIPTVSVAFHRVNIIICCLRFSLPYRSLSARRMIIHCEQASEQASKLTIHIRRYTRKPI